MEGSAWVPALTTSGVTGVLLGIAYWLTQRLISTRLKASVEHEFNERLEAVRAQHRQAEEQLKAELRAREEVLKADLRATELKVSALQGGALSALTSRHAALASRRLEAVDQLWSAVAAMGPARRVSEMMRYIRFKVAAERAEKDPKVRDGFRMLAGGFDPSSIDRSGAVKARPFIPPSLWATYIALMAVTQVGVMRWQLIVGGIGDNDLINYDNIETLIKAALPEYKGDLGVFQESGYSYFEDQLENKLLKQLDDLLHGFDEDKTNIEQIKKIMDAAKEIFEEKDNDLIKKLDE